MAFLEGTVTKVTYFDENKCFGIVKLKLDYSNPKIKEYRTTLYTNIVSVLSPFQRKPIVDEVYSFEGEFEVSPFGMQFKAKSSSLEIEESEEGVVAYLSSEKFKGIGKVTASKIFKALGPSCLTKILDDKSVLDSVNISDAQKELIYEVLVIDDEERRYLIDMLGLGFSFQTAKKLKDELGTNAYEIIKKDPYILMYRVEGFGFVRADAVAEKVGIEKNSPLRIKALILYLLSQRLEESGDTFILQNDFCMYVLSKANETETVVSEDDIHAYLTDLINDGVIIFDDNMLYTKQTFIDEDNLSFLIANVLKEKGEALDYSKFDYCLNDVIKTNGIEYTIKQQEAIKKALEEPIVIINGGPGTGKSTVIKGIIDTYVAMSANPSIASDKIALCAPTGRAAKRLKEVTLHPASTIHRLLKYTGEGNYEINEDNKLDASVVIIDEFSMVDQELAKRLFSSLIPGTKVVIVGDADQLPSVGVGNVLGDLINSKEITTITLDHIHRQKEGSSIIDLAFDLKDGMVPYDIYEQKEDRRFIVKKDEEIISFIESTVEKAIASGMDLVRDVQVLIPIYRGEIGIDVVNVAMQNRFNTSSKSVSKGAKILKERDKVLQTVNRSSKGVMNGDIGYIEEIETVDSKFMRMVVVFDIGRVEYSFDELDDLTLAYAISIHKSQGSEFALAIVPFSFKYYRSLKRKLIYTACTRAKRYLIMLGNVHALSKGVTEIEEDRKTNLVKRIKKYLNGGKPKEEEQEAQDELTPFDFL